MVDDPALGDFIFEMVISLTLNPYAPKLPPVDDSNGVYYVAELFSRLDNPYFTPVYESFKRTVSGDK